MDKYIEKKAYAKINLGLDVTGIRDDGYHLVKMIMQTVDIFDTLTFKENKTGEIRLTASSDKIPTDDSNLICKVARQLKDKYGIAQGADITLEKRIPVAAGMAGGSTDGAAAYVALNELWELGLSKEELCKMGVLLGADIPYCIMGGTMLSEGIGEKLSPIKALRECPLVVAKPDIDVSTGFVYKELDSSTDIQHPDINAVRIAIENDNIEGMCGSIGNVLEAVTAKRYPIVSQIEEILEQGGAIRAFMTGSGPTVFAIYSDEDAAKKGYEAMLNSGITQEIFLTKTINL